MNWITVIDSARTANADQNNFFLFTVSPTWSRVFNGDEHSIARIDAHCGQYAIRYCPTGLSPILDQVTVLDEHYGDLGACLVIIDRDSQLVLECLGTLPFAVPDGVKGRGWHDVLGIPADSSAVVSQFIAAGIAAALPPVIVGAGADGDFLMGGMTMPQQWHGKNAALLFLRPLTTPWGLEAEIDVVAGDIVAVVGVDHLEFSPAWGVPEIESLMMELRCGLRQILREEDWLGLPEGSTIPVVLRGLEPDTALNVCRALSSHLHQFLAGCDAGAQYARTCIGLSQRLQGQTSLSALVAANAALLQAQAGSVEQIRYASPWDPLGQAARSLSATGAFRDALRDERHCRYLDALTALPQSPRRLSDYCARVLEATLEQEGLAAAVLLKQGLHHELLCLSAAVRSETGIESGSVERLPRALQVAVRALDAAALASSPMTSSNGVLSLALRTSAGLQGALLLLQADESVSPFRPGPAALQLIASALANTNASAKPSVEEVGTHLPTPREMEKGIEGYVLDNMEGAIDQAVFLAKVDMPVAIIGEQGTGKMYVAQVIHAEGGGAPEALVRLDCRAFRNRNEAWTRISRELEQGQGRLLVFKSPQLLHRETQSRLARQLASRISSDDGGSHYLAANRYLALFPEDLEALVAQGVLDERLASVFAGYPIMVPPLRERPRAVLRWAHKILEQESTLADRRVSGYTPDAEQALLQHGWAGNISEMRSVITAALERADKEWITPVDLGLFIGISADGKAAAAKERPFLARHEEEELAQSYYAPTLLEELRMTLGQSLAASLATDTLHPLGAWLDDEIIEAALDRCGGDPRGAAEYLGTRSRNIGRWMPKVRQSEQQREASLLWQESRRLIREWVAGSSPQEEAPQQLAQDLLMALLMQQGGDLNVADRARVMGVSTPTYQKRVKQLLQSV
jgi:DNA-binding NtrC family response regulator